MLNISHATENVCRWIFLLSVWMVNTFLNGRENLEDFITIIDSLKLFRIIIIYQIHLVRVRSVISVVESLMVPALTHWVIVSEEIYYRHQRWDEIVDQLECRGKTIVICMFGWLNYFIHKNCWFECAKYTHSAALLSFAFIVVVAISNIWQAIQLGIVSLQFRNYLICILVSFHHYLNIKNPKKIINDTNICNKIQGWWVVFLYHESTSQWYYDP